MRAFFLTVLLVFTSFPAAEGQILDRLRRRAEDALDDASVLQRLLEEPPGITTSIRDAHTEIPFLDGHDPRATALMAALPRTAANAFFAPPGLYEMDALSYCIHAGTYGPTEGAGYALAPLQGDLAPVLRTLVNESVDYPGLDQQDLQSLIWALQSRTPLNDLPPELQALAHALLSPDQIRGLSEGAVDLAKEAFMEEALERVPESVRQVAEVEAELRELLRLGADFEELEAAAVLVGVPSPAGQVRDVPARRWSYHPDGYFIRFDPEDYSLTHIQAYVPEPYRLSRDAMGRAEALVGPRGLRLSFEYETTTPHARGRAAALTRVHLAGPGGTDESWPLDAWTLVGNDLGGDPPGGFVDPGAWEARRDQALALRRHTRDVITSAAGVDSGRPGRDLADLSHLRTGILENQGPVPEAVITHLANAWQHALCMEAGGCPGPRMAEVQAYDESWIPAGGHGPMALPPLSFYEAVPGTPLLPAGGGASVDPGGNVAAPGNTGSQRLLQSSKTPVEKANLAMKALSIFLALADVLGSSGLGSAAYNAMGMFGLPVGHLGLPTMMAGAMISEVVSVWSDATDALAGDTGGGNAGGDEGGDSSGGDEGGGVGDPGTGGVGDPLDPIIDPSLEDPPAGGGGGWEEARSDGEDFENTPPPSPPSPPAPPPSPGGDVSPARMENYNAFSDALMTTLYHTQAMADSELRQEAAAAAGNGEWAQRQAGLAWEHRQQAAQGMMEAARTLEALLDRAEAEGVFDGGYAGAEELAGVQERLRNEGWSGQEMEMAGRLRITPSEMEALRAYMTAQDSEVMAGELGESARLWAKSMRTAGILWMALPGPVGGGG